MSTPFIVEMMRTGSPTVHYLCRCPVGGFVDAATKDRERAHVLYAHLPEDAVRMARETRLKAEFDEFHAVALGGVDDDDWIVQDVFSSGLPGPGYTVHETRSKAEVEAAHRDGKVLPYKECPTCGSVLGIGGKPLGGGCNECR